MSTTYRRKNGKRLEGNALANQMVHDIRGKQLTMVYMRVKNAGLKIRVNKVDGSVTSSVKDSDNTRLNVDLVDGFIRNVWVG